MASPQTENGHLDIANEIAEALARTYLNVTESRVLWVILRKTYGWKKKTDRISYSQFEEMTGVNRRHISDALGSLIRRKIVTRIGNDYRLEYGIQKDYELWESLPIEATNKTKHLQSLPIEATGAIITHRGNTPLPIEATKSLPIEANTKDNKDTIQKKEEEGAPAKKTIKKTAEQHFEEMRQKFPDLNIDIEKEKFTLWWEGKTIRRPGLAVLNWLVKAGEMKKEKQNGATQANRGNNQTGYQGNKTKLLSSDEFVAENARYDREHGFV